MCVERFSGFSSSVFPRLASVPRAGDRLAAPVRPIDSVYANFRHVRGVPSPEGGVSVFQLRMLDRLIDRLLAEGSPPAGPRPSFDVGGLETAALEAEIGGCSRACGGGCWAAAPPSAASSPRWAR